MKTELKDNVWIEGFDDFIDQWKRYQELGQITEHIVIPVFVGKTSDITEEEAKGVVVWDDWSDEERDKGCYRNYANFNEDGDVVDYEVQVGFDTAKESIQSALIKLDGTIYQYCIIWRTK